MQLKKVIPNTKSKDHIQTNRIRREKFGED
jgi:hypothetical protein